MRRVVCVIALGLALGACESFDPGYGEYAYYDRGPGYFVREQQCFEVRNGFGRPFVECRYVKRWKSTSYQQHTHHHKKKRWRDRDDDDDDIYGYREPKRRWRDKEYYD